MSFIIALILQLNSANAFPRPIGPRPVAPDALALNYNFEGIVALSGCSGSLVKFDGQPDTDHAYVLTNGHCYERGFPQAGEIIVNKASSARFTLLKPDGTDAGRIYATHVVYATMTKTDVTLYRVKETYEEIFNRFQIRPLLMSPDHPALQQKIEIISGYWRKGYSCEIDAFVYRLLEGQWEDQDSIRYSNSGCDTIGGTSGSPILARGTRTVIGINNTGNEDGLRCAEDNPCEIDQQGNVFYQKGMNYGQQTHWFYSCLNSQFQIDLTTKGCELFH